MMKVDDLKILTSNFQIQDFNTDICELYCILILFLLNNKIKFEDIIIGYSLKIKWTVNEHLFLNVLMN